MTTTRDAPRGTGPSISLGEPIDIVLGLTAAALTGDQLLKAAQSHDHKTSHLVKAGLGATVTVGALAMLRQDHKDRHHRQSSRGRSEERRETAGARRFSDVDRRPLLAARARTDYEMRDRSRGRNRSDQVEERQGRRTYHGDSLLPLPPDRPVRRDRSVDDRPRQARSPRRDDLRDRHLDDDSRDRGLLSHFGGKVRSHSAHPPPLNDQHLTVDSKGQVYGLNASYYYPEMASRYERRDG